VATAAAKHYARAVFELAAADSQIEEWRRRLETIRDVTSNPAATAVLENPTIPAAQRLDLIDAPEFLDREGINLIRLLIEGRHVHRAPEILDEYERLVDEAEGRVRATVTAAVELSSDERELIGERLSKQIGKEVRITAQVDHRILGGLRLQYGDHLIDASVATRLQQLRRILAGAT
jgi:F-type H+-transporting ATPase subunit delta